ncbi:hypothetical protein [Methylacidimicrobium cyclopophantes]|uniref:hypothetical protein n=1 Tax=Methylacidimicrobium cyclopophantes TaxID=1041766 RepID=UPI0015B557D3|nr:hypothetical protein [Methylacidimicrobium cyclopophantes]
MVAHPKSLRTAETGEHHEPGHAHRRRDMTMGLILIIVIGYLFLMAFVTFHRLLALLLPETPPPSPISPPVPLF